MSFQFNDVLTDASFILVEVVVNTTLGTSVASGSQTATPPSMVGIYVGAELIVDTGTSQETVTVTATTSTTFTAFFVNTHASTAALFGATFPSGQTDAPLISQAEMIAYLSDVQNDFLLKTRILYQITSAATITGNRVYAQPSNAIRLERVAITTGSPAVTTDLYQTSQTSLDLSDPFWQSIQNIPTQWFQDQVNTGNFGLYPLPASIYVLEIWSSVRVAATGNILTTLLSVPDIFEWYMVFGVLARAFSKDGEIRNPQLAEYFKKRYELGLLLTVKFMTGLGVNMDTGTRGDPDFSPLPVAASVTM